MRSARALVVVSVLGCSAPSPQEQPSLVREHRATEARPPSESGLVIAPSFNEAIHSHGGDPAVVERARLRVRNPSRRALRLEFVGLVLRETQGNCRSAIATRERQLTVVAVNLGTDAFELGAGETAELVVQVEPFAIVAECMRRDYVFALKVDGVAHEAHAELTVQREAP